MIAQHQDLTIFDIDDDDVPLVGYGTVDVNGVITEATFSTDPTHPRPYLKLLVDLGESEVDFIKGSSVIGQLTAEIVDAPRIAGDQDSGIFTFLQATADGGTALLGVRVVYRQQRTDGTWEVLFDGIGGPVSMTLLTTFQWQLRDARERERKMRAFDGGTQTVIYPHIGPAEGWGFRTRYDAVTGWAKTGSPVMPPILGMPSRVVHKENDGLAFQFDYYDIRHQSPIRDLLLSYNEPTVPIDDELIAYPYPYFADVIIEWSLDNAVWNQIIQPFQHSITGVGGLTLPVAALFRFVSPLFVTYPREIIVGHVTTAALRPINGANVFVRARSLRPPNEESPLFWQGNLGQLLKDLYDGVYSPIGTTPVRYDVDQMAVFIRQAPFGQALINAPVDELREWGEENIYRPCRSAPAIRDGRVFPIKYELPDATIPLVALDNTNIITATWKHDTKHIVNRVTVEYDRDTAPSNTGITLSSLKTQKIILERNRLEDNSQRRHGVKPETFKPVTLRSVIADSFVAQVVGVRFESGRLFAIKVMEELLRRFTNGAQECEVECRRTTPVDGLREGDWVTLGASFLPDYVSRRRGINRLMQVTKVLRTAPHKRGFLLLDAGPHDQPLAQPTIGVAVANNDLSVTIPVTVIPATVAGTQAEVQFAMGVAQPETDSGQWLSLEPIDIAGNVTTPPLAPGETVWYRGRSVHPTLGRRPSAWTNADSLVLTVYAELVKFDVEILEDGSVDAGKPRVAWDQRLGTAGVRILYEVHDPGTDSLERPLASSVDVDASDLTFILPIVLRQFEQVTVGVDAYPGWTGAAVSGGVGAQSDLKTSERSDASVVMPTVIEEKSQDEAKGRLILHITDPQLRITTVEFRTRVGDAGLWSDWIEDTAAPYETEVALIDDEISLIEYRITGYDANGDLVITSQVPVTYRDVLGTPSHVVIDVSPILRRVTLTVRPITATIRWRLDGGNWNEATNIDGRVTLPDVNVGNGDRVLEYQTKLSTGELSEIKRIVLDEDAEPEVDFSLFEDPAFNIQMNLDIDDDTAHWRGWARRGAWPTIDGTLATEPLDRHKVYDGNVEIDTINWRTSGNEAGVDTGDRWYVIARGYDEFWNYFQHTDSILIAGVAANVGALTNVRVIRNEELSLRYNDILWDHNDYVQNNSHTVRVLEDGVQLVTGRDPRVEHDGLSAVSNVGGYHTEKPAYDETGERLTHTYTIELYEGIELIDIYTRQFTDWYALGGGDGDPPVEVPTGPAIDFPNDGSTPRALWNNTSAIWLIRIEWSIATASGGPWEVADTVNLPANTSFNDFASTPGEWTRFRVQYYNGFGDGAWSGFSAPAQST